MPKRFSVLQCTKKYCNTRKGDCDFLQDDQQWSTYGYCRFDHERLAFDSGLKTVRFLRTKECKQEAK